MDRLLPPRRHEPVTLDVADTIAATSAIVAAVAAGDLTAAEAADLAKVVDVHVQALATAAFRGRAWPGWNKVPCINPARGGGRPVCKARTLVAFAVWHLPPSACVHRPCPLASKHTEPRPPKDRFGLKRGLISADKLCWVFSCRPSETTIAGSSRRGLCVEQFMPDKMAPGW